ncbi:MAG: ribosome small subunit-dependent GTPase A, partial [Myxococcota bacterium]
MSARPGRVVATRGRRVVVADAEGERTCFLSGHRAVVGDRVKWVEARGEGGKLVSVDRRETALVRADARGREQVLAANLSGIAVVTAPRQPPFRAGLLDRYVVAAAIGGLASIIVLNKCDQGVPEDVERALVLRETAGTPVLRTSARDGEGVEALADRLRDGVFAFVGHSGVGKTSLARALLPGVDVGEIGDLSEHWGTGQHTTTSSRVFALPGGGELVDSPGIRTFAPGRLTAVDVRRYFPMMGALRCKFRDCLHREGEQGCAAPDEIDAELLASYRRLLGEIR